MMTKQINKIDYTKIMSPIFIVGTPRSGTTLLAKVLGNHSNIFMPGETHFFDDILSNKNILGDPTNCNGMNSIIKRLSTLYIRYNEPEDQKRVDKILFNNRKLLNNFKEKCSNYKDIYFYFMVYQANYHNKKRWGNNVPRDIFNVDKIIDFFPNAKIIVCVRDVRDFLSSYKDRWKVVPFEHSNRVRAIYHPILTSLLWLSSIKLIPKIQTKINKKNLKIIKYENFVLNPEKTIKDVCLFIDEKFEKQMLNVSFSNSSFNKKNTGIYTDSIGKWIHSLKKEEIYIAQKIGGKDLKKLGYKNMEIRPSYIIVFYFLISLVIKVFKTLYSTKEYRGSTITYVKNRLKHLINFSLI